MARLLAQPRRCRLWDGARLAASGRLGGGRAALSGARTAGDLGADEPHLRGRLHRAGAGPRTRRRGSRGFARDCGRGGLSRLHRHHLRAAAGAADARPRQQRARSALRPLASGDRPAARQRGKLCDQQPAFAGGDPRSGGARSGRAPCVRRRARSGGLRRDPDLLSRWRSADCGNPAGSRQSSPGAHGYPVVRGGRGGALFRAAGAGACCGDRARICCRRTAVGLAGAAGRAAGRAAAQHHALRISDPQPQGAFAS